MWSGARGRRRQSSAVVVTGTNGTQAEKNMGELGEEIRDTEDQIEFLCFHTAPVDLRV